MIQPKQKVVKRKYVKKRIPTMMTDTADTGSESTVTTLNQTDIKRPPRTDTLHETAESSHVKDVHTQIRVAPLDKFSDADYTGFANLLILLFFIMISRLAIENYRKYGNLVHIPHITADESYFVFLSVFMLMGHFTAGFWIEQSRQTLKLINNSMRWHVFNALFIILEQTIYVAKYCSHPGLGIALLLFSSILILKLLSFAFVTTNMRLPVSLSSYINFLFVPTLCFQYSYPKAPTRSIFKALRYLCEFLLSMACMLVLSQQYAEPTLETSITLMKSGDLSLFQLLERIMKLSISVSLIWLAMFYGLFHAYLYFWAEVTQFGDRLFYRDWWNASDLGTYWRLWNQPVHQWLKRHVFIPMLQDEEERYVKETPGSKKIKVTKFQAGLLVFLISALFHEWIIAIPTKIYNLWAFFGIFGQIPLIVLSSHFDSWYRTVWRPGYTGVNTAGNIFFWTTFCIFGQPMASYLYYRKWNINNSPELYKITQTEILRFCNGTQPLTFLLDFFLG